MGDAKNMLRLKIRITRPITYTVKALNSFARTCPAIISAKCFPKCGKRIHTEGIFRKYRARFNIAWAQRKQVSPFHFFFNLSGCLPEKVSVQY